MVRPNHLIFLIVEHLREKTMFENIISNQFKATYQQAIDGLLADTGLTVPCLLKYDFKKLFCSNCVFDSMSNRSSNIYNSTGPQPFPSYGICPVCNGTGYIETNNSETLYLAVIFDPRLFVKLGSSMLNIPEGSVQTISKFTTINKIKNANSIIFNTNIADYAQYEYIRDGEPNPCGLGEHQYIITMWKKK